MELVQNLTYEGACSGALVFEKYTKNKVQSNFRSIRPQPRTTPTNNQKTSRTETFKTQSKDKTSALMKDVICFKCHGHGHCKSEYPNARAFTQREWVEINSRFGPRAMLVFLDEQEEVVLPSTLVDGPDGSYTSQ